MWNSTFRYDPDSDEELQMDSEKVMKEVQKLYTTKDIGIRDAAKSFDLRILVPRQKTTVLIVGHHALAKQKFLDLYFDEPRLGKGSFISRVNYDKMDKIYITHGNRRKWLSGENVLDYCPHLAQLKNVPGVKDHLTTEISSQKTKSLVSFILAPENRTAATEDAEEHDPIDVNNNSLDPHQPFQIEKAIGTLAEAADLIFIFFDPTGLHCPRLTLKPFGRLWTDHHEKIHLILAKADPDECSEREREDTLTEVVRETWRIPEVRNVGYLPLIYCPDLTSRTKDEERLWTIIQTEADKSVHRALDQLEQDATKVKKLLEAKLEKHNSAKSYTKGPPTAYLWIIVVFAMIITMCVSEVNDALCRNPGPDWRAVCGQMISNRAFLTGIGVIAFIFTARSLLMEPKALLLSPAEEEMLNRRIQFVQHALNEKEEIEKKYIAISSSESSQQYKY